MVEDNKEGTKGKKKIKEETAEPIAQTISLFLAIGLIIGSLIIGLGLGYAIAPKGDNLSTGIQNGQKAPALTPDQVQGGKLPAGHPQIPAGTSSTSTSSTTEGSTATQTPSK